MTDSEHTPNKEEMTPEELAKSQIGTRSTALNRLMVVPILMALALAVATGTLMLKMTEERQATGERITLSLEGECLNQAKSVVVKRGEEVGVGDLQFTETQTGMDLTLTLPSIPDAETKIPKLLLRRGLWTMKDGETILLDSEDVSKATLSLDESGMPEALLSFDPISKQEAQAYLDAHQEGNTVLWLDDQKIITRPNTIDISDEFRLVSNNTDPKVRMMESADFVILLSHPTIDCDIQWSIQKRSP